MDVLIHSDGTYELYHYGVKGQKWGVRRYQDYNGRLKRGHEKRYGEPPSAVRKQRDKKKVESGKKFVDNFDKYKALKTIKTTAAVASGAFWLTSAIATGNVAMTANRLAALTSIVSAIPHDHK